MRLATSNDRCPTSSRTRKAAAMPASPDDDDLHPIALTIGARASA
jgi:hypothetical protein